MIIHIEIGFHPKCSKFEERFKRCFNSFLYYSDLISKMIGRSFLHQNCFEFSWFFFLCRLHLLQFTDRYVMQHFPVPFCFVKYRKKLYVYETLYEVLLHLEIWREKKRIFVRGSTRHSFKQWVVCLGIYRIFEKNKKGFDIKLSSFQAFQTTHSKRVGMSLRTLRDESALKKNLLKSKYCSVY